MLNRPKAMGGARGKPTADSGTIFRPAGPTSVEDLSRPPTPTPSIPVPTGQIEIGDVLNHIYEVKRLIGRGGMGEVYEGINIASDERVAIKVMLPSLAADPHVQGMFRKEARTLTRISHPAIVPYRVLAQEPRLGLLYIVTEFIEGYALSDVLETMRPTTGELVRFLRRMADGLRAAHELGAIHRDIAPDNILLQDGRLERAKIIDFGIAKELEPTRATIVGDGFAGKLGYVAPEQFGDFHRRIGPWTDVYSLGLVVLALAGGRPVNMGTTLVEAIERRRAGLDLTPIPLVLKPTLERMLQPDPSKRFQSMDEVLLSLDAAVGPPTTAFSPGPLLLRRRRPLALPLILGTVGALSLALAGTILTTRPRAVPETAAAPEAPAALVPTDQAQAALAAALPTIGCTWLTANIAPGGSGLSVTLTGAANSPATARAAVWGALAGVGVQSASVGANAVRPVENALCPVLDAFHDVGAAGRARLSVDDSQYELARRPGAARPDAQPTLHLAIGDPNLEFALLRVASDGSVTPIVGERADLQRLPLRGLVDAKAEAGDAFTLKTRVGDAGGWSGFVLLTGQGPFDLPLLGMKPSERPADWSRRVEAAAKADGWRAEAVWLRVVDRRPPPAPPSVAAKARRILPVFPYNQTPKPPPGHPVQELNGLL